MHAWCTLADSPEAREACTLFALRSLYWGGENDRSASTRFCALAPEGFRDRCFDELIWNVGYYIDDTHYRRAFCGELPQEQQGVCREKLL